MLVALAVEVENDAVSTNEAGIIASCSGGIAVWFASYDNRKRKIVSNNFIFYLVSERKKK